MIPLSSPTWSRWLLALATWAVSPVAASAEMFVSNRGTSEVLVFADDANGNTAPLRRIGGPLTQILPGALNGIALDTRNGEIFVSVSNDLILVFDALADGNVAPLRTIRGPATGLSFPAGLAVDVLNDELYVVDGQGDRLLVFPRAATGNSAPLRAIEGGATGINQPTAVFVNLDTDEVFVTNESSPAGVNIFPRLGQGNISPARRIAGPATTLSFAVGTFTNPQTGEQLVSDLMTGRVLTFPAGTDGDLAPIRELSSNALSSAAGITLTNDGEMLVNGLLSDAVLGFDVAANGLTVPSREVRGSLTGLDTPIYIVSGNSPFPGAVFSSAPLAMVATRNAGGNPASYSALGPPILGEDLELTVDLTLTGGTSALLLLSSLPGTQALPGGQVLLVDRASTRILGPFAGPIVNVTLAVPSNPSLAGVTFFTQAVHASSGSGFALSNAVDLTFGF